MIVLVAALIVKNREIIVEDLEEEGRKGEEGKGRRTNTLARCSYFALFLGLGWGSFLMGELGEVRGLGKLGMYGERKREKEVVCGLR